MRKNRADQDPQIRVRHRSKDPDRNAFGRGSEILIGGKIIDGRAEALVSVHDRVSNSQTHRFRVHGVMAADPDADRDVLGT
jgi:hypothetical protein